MQNDNPAMTKNNRCLLPAFHTAVAAIMLVAIPFATVRYTPCEAFVSLNGQRSQPRSSLSTSSSSLSSKSTKHFMSKQYDVSKPVFDLLSFQQVRGDALIRYDTMNQSEPLRIALFAILTSVLASAPSLSEALGYDQMSTAGTVASLLSAVASAGLFVRECKNRSQQLRRLVLELETELLPIRLPTSLLSDRPFTQPVTLKDCRQQLSQPPRIIACIGTPSQTNLALTSLSVFGIQRLKQASVYVVVVVLTDSDDDYGGSTRGVRCLSPTDAGWATTNIGEDDSDNTNKNFVPGRTNWLADPYQPQVWLEYFARLSSTSKTSDQQIGRLPSFRWFGLNANGRSFGSGDDDIPQWLQLLGQHLRPTELLDPSDPSYSSSSNIAHADTQLLQNATSMFYQALTTGDKDGITKIFSTSKSDLVTEVIDGGGRIDSWADCLADGARPSGMTVSGTDVTIISPTEAYTTTIEFPANTGLDGCSATLLAVQKWVRDSDGEPWQLEVHQTIPWSPETQAQGTLRCDCRGCVALTRTQERRTFGGIIG